MIYGTLQSLYGYGYQMKRTPEEVLRWSQKKMRRVLKALNKYKEKISDWTYDDISSYDSYVYEDMWHSQNYWLYTLLEGLTTTPKEYKKLGEKYPDSVINLTDHVRLMGGEKRYFAIHGKPLPSQ